MYQVIYFVKVIFKRKIMQRVSILLLGQFIRSRLNHSDVEQAGFSFSKYWSGGGIFWLLLWCKYKIRWGWLLFIVVRLKTISSFTAIKRSGKSQFSTDFFQNIQLCRRFNFKTNKKGKENRSYLMHLWQNLGKIEHTGNRKELFSKYDCGLTDMCTRRV